MSHEAVFSCNLQRNGVSSCLLQEKSPPVTLRVCKIIRLQVIQQLAYVYNSTGACNIFFTQTLRCKLQEKIASCDSALCDWEINVLKFNCELWLTVQICIGRQYYFQQGKLKYIIQSRNPVEIQPHSANLILYNLILFILVLVPALET